jgi:hypothetical protein
LREQQLRSDEAIFKMQQSLAESKLALRDQAHQVKVGAEEQVKKVKEQSTVREQQVAKQAQGGVTQSLTAVQRATQQVQQLAEAVTAMQTQAQATQQLLADLLTTTKAKRVKRAIRGTDNRIERVEEELIA